MAGFLPVSRTPLSEGEMQKIAVNRSVLKS
jgi:hypothetical protein